MVIPKIKVYHGTSLIFANKITKLGFGTPDVWVTCNESLAKSYAEDFKNPVLLVLEIPIYTVIGGSMRGDEEYDKEFNFEFLKNATEEDLKDNEIENIGEFIEGMKEEYEQWILDNTQDKPHEYIVDIIKL